MTNQNHYTVEVDAIADFGAPPEDSRSRKSVSVVHRPGVVDSERGYEWPSPAAKSVRGPAVRPLREQP
ncbi:hypothetical protein ACFWIO_17285 [Streptomyces diastatochromogenes]|uniref:hypothetical protein n=1 Tax=Streptomyces diastatochromogenes TaxID=42236 RepID=UPI003652B107